MPAKHFHPPTGSGLAVGIALGVAIGAAMHNIGLGIAIGVAIGIAFDASGRRKAGIRKDKDDKDG